MVGLRSFRFRAFLGWVLQFLGFLGLGFIDRVQISGLGL